MISGRVIVNPDISCRVESDDYALLFNPDTDNTVLIDHSGLLIWRFIDEPRSINDIISYLKGCFSNCPDIDTLEQDIIKYLSDLIPEFVLEIF